MKKSIILILSLIVGFGSLSAVHGTGNESETVNKASIVYKDINKTNWAYESINEMTRRNIVNGFPDGRFKPDETVTYGEFIKMALMADQGKDVGNSASPDHWAKNYYDTALELNYFNPYQVHQSQLDAQIPRGDMALIISSVLGDINIENYDAIQGGIKDITSGTKYEYDITKAYATGILTGYTDKTFRPDKSLSRAEATMVIYRLADETKRQLPKIESEANTGKVEDIIKNSDSFINPGNGTVNEDLAAAETYTIVEDASMYRMSLMSNRGTNWIQIDSPSGLHQMYLMRDGNIVESMATGYNDTGKTATYNSDIAHIDYIVSLRVSDNSMLLIVNPFRK